MEDEIVVLMKKYRDRIALYATLIDACTCENEKQILIGVRGTLYECVYDLNEIMNYPIVLKPLV